MLAQCTQAACVSVRSTSRPFSKRALARTSGTRWAPGDRAPAGLGGLDQLEHHRERGGGAAGAAGDLGAELDGGGASGTSRAVRLTPHGPVPGHRRGDNDDRSGLRADCYLTSDFPYAVRGRRLAAFLAAVFFAVVFFAAVFRFGFTSSCTSAGPAASPREAFTFDTDSCNAAIKSSTADGCSGSGAAGSGFSSRLAR